jgi:pilus assembly protein FimV
MDFDVTSSSIAKVTMPEVTKLDIPAMDFDVTTKPTVPAAVAASPAEAAPALNLDDLVFDISTPTSTPAAVAAVPAAAAEQGMAFTIDFPTEAKPDAAAKPAAPVKDVGLSEISLSLDSFDTPATAIAPKGEQWQEVATKLDLAKAYQEMGDQDGAREILDEVMRDGDETQRATAQALLDQLV